MAINNEEANNNDDSKDIDNDDNDDGDDDNDNDDGNDDGNDDDDGDGDDDDDGNDPNGNDDDNDREKQSSFASGECRLPWRFTDHHKILVPESREDSSSFEFATIRAFLSRTNRVREFSIVCMDVPFSPINSVIPPEY